MTDAPLPLAYAVPTDAAERLRRVRKTFAWFTLAYAILALASAALTGVSLANARSAMPWLSYAPLFVPAAAVVVDVGALLSHSIIVSRELGIPCVPSASDATRRIPDGARVRVDGDAGVVTLLALPG